MDSDLAEDGDSSSHNLKMTHGRNDSGLDVEDSSKKKLKGIDYTISSGLSCLSMNNTLPENVVQNGTTSHHNMALDTNVLEGGYFELGKCIDSASSNINLDKHKGKVIEEDNNFHNKHNIEAHSNILSEGLACRRHAPIHTSSLPYEEANDLSKQGTSYQLLNSKHKNVVERKNYATHADDILKIAAYTSNPNVNWRHQKFMRWKRKQHLSNFCESSGVTSENSETSLNQLSRLIPSDGWSSISSQNNSYYCDELDELQSPNLRLNNYSEQNFQFDDDIARISQMESDELLARQLQEQYNEEVAGAMSTNEMDANISGPSQETDSHLAASTTRSDQKNNMDANISGPSQETDSHLAASTTRSDQTNNMDANISGPSQETDSHLAVSTIRSDQTNNKEESMSDLFGYYTQLASHDSLSRSSNHSQHQTSNERRSFHSSEIGLEGRLMAELRNFTKMDPEKKRDLLEALEAAFDQSNSAFDDLNEDDYEILLTLKAGASENQISSLPQSTIQGGKVEEMCTICLTVPSVGEKIRHLPCLHKFHLECIDVWLRRRACCPICMLKIS